MLAWMCIIASLQNFLLNLRINKYVYFYILSVLLMRYWLIMIVCSIFFIGQVFALTTQEQQIVDHLDAVFVASPELRTSILSSIKRLARTAKSSASRTIFKHISNHYTTKKRTQTQTSSGSVTPSQQCSIFPAQHPINQKITNLSVHPLSDKIIAKIANRRNALHADFGANRDGGPFGIPFIYVNATTPKIETIATDYADESDQGSFPIPLNAPIEK